jgi:hypothetical protein
MRGEGEAVRSARPGFIAGICLLLAAPFLVNTVIEARLPDAVTLSLDGAAPAGWSSSAATGSAWKPLQYGADREDHRRLERDGVTVESYTATYLEQRVGKKLGGYGNRLGGNAEVLESGTAQSAQRKFGTSVLREANGQSLLWYSYEVAGRSFTNATRAQLWYSWVSLWTLQSPTSRAVAFRTPCESGCTGAGAVLDNFVSEGGVLREAN